MPIGTLKLMYDALYYTIKSTPVIFVAKLIKNKNINAIIDIVKNMKHDTSPLDISYYSTTPYMFGNRIVKYSIVPRSKYKSRLPKKLGNNYLTENMQKHLYKEEAVFDFMIQFYINDIYTPINDASIEWKSDKSPFIKLGEIRIPKQRFTTKKRFDLAEIMSFSPGHSLLSHRPIGDMNEGRIKIYKEMSKYRHYRNKEELKSRLLKKLGNNYLTENMQKHLYKEEAIFDFMIQFYINDIDTPINDASIEWESDKSSFIKLGEIRIPKQRFTTKKRFDLAEIMSFSPGHSLLSHKPIGDMNEGRMEIYKEMSKYRHYRNNEELYEPSDEDFDNI